MNMKDQKIMIIVPHEDDELNIAGGLLLDNNIDKKNCYVVFMTNGDYAFKCKTRIKEALKSCKYLGVPYNNIIFMGYPDQHFNSTNHIYHTNKNVVTSESNHQETYCYQKNEFHYQKYNQHASYTFNNLLNDFLVLIKEYTPDIFYVIDFDSHPDHRCCSLTFEKALGLYLKENKTYYPKVYKGFAYPTAYRGCNDFNRLNLESTKFITEDFSLTKYENPYYNWQDRVRFPVGASARRKILLFNKWYRAIKKHRSQITLLRNSYCIMNNDQIFWLRRTDNLARLAHITVSSGDKEYLTDFLLFDCQNILDGNIKKPQLLENSWQPDHADKEKTIKYTFPKSYNIKEIYLYQNDLTKNFITKISITFSNNKTLDYDLNKEYVNKINVSEKNIKWLEIKVLNKDLKHSGFSEIEIISDHDDPSKFLKILNDDDFIYNNYVYDKLNINVYYFNGIQSEQLPLDNYNFYVDNEKINYSQLNHISKNKFHLKVTLKSNETIYDEVILKKMNSFYKLMYHVRKTFNNIILNIDIFKNRVINKIKRMMNDK